MRESLPDFMSEEHVARMNTSSKESAQLNQMCSKLDRDYLWVQQMLIRGSVLNWQLNFTRDEGFYFSLGDFQKEPDLIQRGKLFDMIAAINEVASTGKMGDPKLEDIGDTSIITTLEPIFNFARTVCTVPARLPELKDLEE